MNALYRAIQVANVESVWPGIEWTSQTVDGVFWIAGTAKNGQEAQRGLPLRDLLKGTATNVLDTFSATCQEIAHELQPTFIDWSLVGCA